LVELLACLLLIASLLAGDPSQPLERFPEFVVRLSRGYAGQFQHDESIALMSLAIALDRESPQLHVERGQRIMLLYEWDRALADFNRALALDPTCADAYYYRGVLYASVPEGDSARRLALADFRRSLDLAPDGLHAEDAARAIELLAAQLQIAGEAH
jgi:tetratricopeptide (TPR) repeat protein